MRIDTWTYCSWREASYFSLQVQAELVRFHGGIKRLSNPHQYPVGLEQGLHDLKTALILKHRSLAKEKK